jgi:toxoflavin synthase
VLALALAIIGAFLATIATGVSMWQGFILRKQLQNDVSVRRASFHQDVANLFIQLDLIFVENPELRPCFYDNQTPSDPRISQQALALSEYIVDLAESCTAAEVARPELIGDWDDYFSYLYRSSPTLREYWADFGHLYPANVARAFVGPSASPKQWPERGEPAIVGDESEVVEASDIKDEMRYTERQAVTYESVALEGSTFEIGLLPAISSMGNLDGMTVLDFGAGAGRSACALRNCGASRVVAVDRSANMLKTARRCPGVSYLQVGRSLPINQGSMDAVLCANVFSEFSALADVVSACREVWRVLDTGRVFVVIVPNPDSLSCDYVSYRYIDVVHPKSGSPMTCLLKGPEQIFIQDYYWSFDDYKTALQAAGFEVDQLLLPIAKQGSGNWLDETRVAPDLVIRSIRVDGQCEAR